MKLVGLQREYVSTFCRGLYPRKRVLTYDTFKKEKVSVNGIDIFLLEAQDAAWLASYQWNIRARFITS